MEYPPERKDKGKQKVPVTHILKNKKHQHMIKEVKCYINTAQPGLANQNPHK